MMFVDNREGLIGDFLGTIPTMEALADKQEIIVRVRDEVYGLFDLVKHPNIKDYGKFYFQKPPAFDLELNCTEAFKSGHDLYMSQAFMKLAGLEVPKVPPKAKLDYSSATMHVGPVDYLISPFARSLPEEQKLSREKWQTLTKAMPDKKFGVLGNYKYDNPLYVNGPNVQNFYSLSFDVLCRLFKNSGCLISVVTGTAHLAFHLGVKNVLLTNQNMAWGNNPDAIKITNHIPDIKVEEIMQKL